MTFAHIRADDEDLTRRVCPYDQMDEDDVMGVPLSLGMDPDQVPSDRLVPHRSLAEDRVAWRRVAVTLAAQIARSPDRPAMVDSLERLAKSYPDEPHYGEALRAIAWEPKGEQP